MNKSAKEILEDKLRFSSAIPLSDVQKHFVYLAMYEFGQQEARSFANWLSNEVIAGRTIDKLWNDYQKAIS